MKELSIEEKAERYDKAFGIARNVWRFSSNNAEIMRMECRDIEKFVDNYRKYMEE